MELIMSSVEEAKECEFNLKFTPTLVRGQSYYTGTIFEVTMDDFGGSVAGGGRYDRMIGKFTGQDTPACGFSIGFERIVMLLLENGYKVPAAKEKKAYLLEKKLPKESMLKVLAMAKKDREEGKQGKGQGELSFLYSVRHSCSSADSCIRASHICQKISVPFFQHR